MKKILSFLWLSLVLIACSSGGNLGYTGTGVRCGANPDPFPFDMDGKPGFKVEPDNTLPPGYYTLVSAEANYFVPGSDVQIRMRDSHFANDDIKTTRACMRNALNFEVLPEHVKFADTNYVAGFQVDSNHTVINLKMKEFGFKIERNIVEPKFTKKDAAPPGKTIRVIFGEQGFSDIRTREEFRIYGVNVKDTNEMNNYQIRAIKTETRAPFRVTEVIIFLKWTKDEPVLSKFLPAGPPQKGEAKQGQGLHDPPRQPINTGPNRGRI